VNNEDEFYASWKRYRTDSLNNGNAGSGAAPGAALAAALPNEATDQAGPAVALAHEPRPTRALPVDGGSNT
jgi:hypothetical protein